MGNDGVAKDCKGKSKGNFDMSPWMAMMVVKGCKGKSKGEGKEKGKGRCSAKRVVDEVDNDSMECKPRACAREGCSFAATWHPTHCCGSCAHSKGEHGPRCEHKPMPEMAAQGGVKHEEVTTGKQQMANQEFGFDFAFPVVVEDGRRLTIAWNKLDDLQQVAEGFMLEHSIPPEEFPTIKGFLEHATTTFGVASQSEEVATSESVAKENEEEGEVLNQATLQLAEMGLGDLEVLRELLKQQGGSVQKVIETLTAQ